MDFQLWIARCIRFIKMSIESDSVTVNTINNMGFYGSYLIMGGNLRFLKHRYDITVNYTEYQTCNDNEDYKDVFSGQGNY